MKKFIAVTCCIAFCGLAVFAAEFISNNRSADSAVPSQSAESLPFSADISKAVGNTSKQAVSQAEGESSAAEKAENKADTVRIVANGDSITFGHMPSTAGDGELIPNRGYEGMTNGVSFVTLACRNLGFELDNGARQGLCAFWYKLPALSCRAGSACRNLCLKIISGYLPF